MRRADTAAVRVRAANRRWFLGWPDQHAQFVRFGALQRLALLLGAAAYTTGIVLVQVHQSRPINWRGTILAAGLIASVAIVILRARRRFAIVGLIFLMVAPAIGCIALMIQHLAAEERLAFSLNIFSIVLEVPAARIAKRPLAGARAPGAHLWR